MIHNPHAHEFYIGDILICQKKMIQQAEEFSIDNESEFVHLLVHGFLHLLGFDHEISFKEEKIMGKWEEFLIKNYSLAKRNRKFGKL